MDTITVTRPAIKPAEAIVGTHRQATITGLHFGQISALLGFDPNVENEPEHVEYSWAFTVDGVHCAVWDYRGAHRRRRFSAFGPVETLKAVFGADHVEY